MELLRQSSALDNPAKSVSMLSSTTRFALIAFTAWPRRMNNPSRLDSPLSSISFRSMRTWSSNSFLRFTSSPKSRPRDQTLVASLSVASSNSMHTPGSPHWSAPCTRNSIASKVLPQPALPHTRRGTALRQPSARYFIQSFDSCRGFWQRRARRFFNLARGMGRPLKLVLSVLV